MIFQREKVWRSMGRVSMGVGLCLLGCNARSQTPYYTAQPIVIPLSSRFIDSGIGVTSVPGTTNITLHPLTIFEALESNPLLHVVKTASTEKILFPGAPSGGSVVVWEGVVLNDPSTTQDSFDFSLLKEASFQKVDLERGTNPLLTTAALGGVMTLQSPSLLSSPQKQHSPTFLGRGGGDSVGGKFIQLNQSVPLSQGVLYLGSGLYNNTGAPVGQSPLRKRQSKRGESLSVKGFYGSLDKTQLVFLCRTAHEKFDDLYDEQGTFEGGSHYLIGRVKNLSQDGQTRSNASISQIRYERAAFHQSLKLSNYKGSRQSVKLDGTHSFQKGLQIQGGVEALRETAEDYGYRAVRDTLSLFVGPGFQIFEGMWGEGSVRVDQGPRDALWGVMTGLRYERGSDAFYTKVDMAQKRPSLYYLNARNYEFPQYGTLPRIAYPVGNSALSQESSWGVTTGLSKAYLRGEVIGAFDVFYRKFDNFIYATTVAPATYAQGGDATTWGFGPRIQLGSHALKFKSQIQWLRVSHASNIPALALTPAHAQAINQLTYESDHKSLPPVGAYLCVTTSYKPYSTLGQTKSHSLVSTGAHYGIQKNLLCFVRVTNLFNKRIQDPYESNLKGDPFSFRVGMEIEL